MNGTANADMMNPGTTSTGTSNVDPTSMGTDTPSSDPTNMAAPPEPEDYINHDIRLPWAE